MLGKRKGGGRAVNKCWLNGRVGGLNKSWVNVGGGGTINKCWVNGGGGGRQYKRVAGAQ